MQPSCFYVVFELDIAVQFGKIIQNKAFSASSQVICYGRRDGLPNAACTTISMVVIERGLCMVSHPHTPKIRVMIELFLCDVTEWLVWVAMEFR
jgi:hypothetical protein